MENYKLEFYLLKMATNSALFLGYINDKDKLVSMLLYNSVFDTELYSINQCHNPKAPVFTKLSKEEATEYMLNNCPDIHDLFFTKII